MMIVTNMVVIRGRGYKVIRGYNKGRAIMCNNNYNHQYLWVSYSPHPFSGVFSVSPPHLVVVLCQILLFWSVPPNFILICQRSCQDTTPRQIKIIIIIIMIMIMIMIMIVIMILICYDMISQDTGGPKNMGIQ